MGYQPVVGGGGVGGSPAPPGLRWAGYPRVSPVRGWSEGGSGQERGRRPPSGRVGTGRGGHCRLVTRAW